MSAPAKPRVSGWYVDVDGHKSGPHTVEEIRELLIKKRVQAEQRVFSESDLPRPGETLGERTSARLLRVGELLDQYTDPALSLLDALQAARGKSRPAPTNVQNAVAEERNSPAANASASPHHPARIARGIKNPDRKPNLPPQIAIFIATAMIAAAVVWGTLEMLKHGSGILPPAQTAAKGAEGIKSAPLGETFGAVTPPTAPGAAAAPAVAPPPTTQPINPSVGGGIASRLKPRPFSRPLASIPNQGRPTPPQTAEQNERDAAEAKEREQHERDVRDSQDQGGGGGQPIDGEPNNQAPPPPPPGNQIDPYAGVPQQPGGQPENPPQDPNLQQN